MLRALAAVNTEQTPLTALYSLRSDRFRETAAGKTGMLPKQITRDRKVVTKISRSECDYKPVDSVNVQSSDVKTSFENDLQWESM